MKTEIGQLNLHLPAGFEDRAQRIGRLVGEALASRESLPRGRIAQLGVGPVRVDPRHSDHTIARFIARSIHAAIAQRS